MEALSLPVRLIILHPGSVAGTAGITWIDLISIHLTITTIHLIIIVWGRGWSSNQNVRFHADNITVFSFDKTGQPEWNNVIVKEQFDDQSDDQISYQVMITGGELHFLFNQSERRVQLLNDYSVAPGGQMNRNPTLKNLDKGYEFMPRYAKQVSSKQIIIPCITRNYICFAKVDYN